MPDPGEMTPEQRARFNDMVALDKSEMLLAQAREALATAMSVMGAMELMLERIMPERHAAVTRDANKQRNT